MEGDSCHFEGLLTASSGWRGRRVKCAGPRGAGELSRTPPPTHTSHLQLGIAYVAALPRGLYAQPGCPGKAPEARGRTWGHGHVHTHTELLPWGRQGRAGLPPSCKQPRGGSRTARPAHSPDNPHHQMLLGDFSSSRGCLRRLPTLLLVFPARASPFPAPRRGSGQRLLGPLQAPAHPRGSGDPPEDGSGGFPEALCPKSPGLGFVSSSPTILPPDGNLGSFQSTARAAQTSPR